MPFYEYQCEECNRVNEFFVREAGETPDRATLICAHCRGTHLRRVPSTIAVRFTKGMSACPTGTCSLNQGSRD